MATHGLIRHDPASIRSVLGPYGKRVADEGVVLDDVYLTDAQSLECVLAKAAARHTTIAEVFTDDLFLRGGNVSFLLEPQGLSQVAREFDFHTVFPVTTKLRDGGTATMRFLLVGQGKVVIGYDKAGTYTHPDREYSVWGFNGYDLSPYIRMDVTSDAHGHRTITNLGVAGGPEQQLRSFEGPGNFTIRQLSLMGPRLVIPGRPWKIRPLPVAERTPDGTLAKRLQAIGCPSTKTWGAADLASTSQHP
jgi:hypothetical protein